MAWQVIQSAAGDNYASSVAATFSTANVQAGNKIIAVVISSWSTGPTSVRDGALNNWTLCGSKTSGTGSVWLYALDVPAGDAGTKPTITATFAGTSDLRIIILEVSGLLAGNTAAMLDGTAQGLSGTSAATGSPAYSSTAAGEWLVCCYGAPNSATVPVNLENWTLDPASGVNGAGVASVEYTNSSGGAETSGWTGADTGGWSILTVAFGLAPTGSESGPNYAGAASGLAGGTGSWANAGNAAGTDDGTYAVWTAP